MGDTVGGPVMDMVMAEGPAVTTITGTVTTMEIADTTMRMVITMEIADTTMIAMAGAFKIETHGARNTCP